MRINIRLSVMLMLLIAMGVEAADPLTEVGERFLEEQRRNQELDRLRERQENFKAAPIYMEVPSEDACFDIRRITITGNSLISQRSMKLSVEKYTNKCLGKDAINQLMQELTQKYITKGYITSRVYIPPQDLTTGVLELVVVEGQVEAVSINNNSNADRRKLWWAMSPAWGRHLRLPEIEQALDQINSVPSASAQMKLWPGRDAGSTHIQILNKVDDEFRGDISVSNDGQKGTGLIKTRVGLSADNIIGINDTASVNLISSSNTNALALSGAFPFRRWNFNLSHSYSEYLNILPENTDLFGQSNTSTVGSNYLVYRDQSVRASIISSLTLRKSERHLLGVSLTPQTLVPFRIAANVSQNNRWGYYSVEIGHVEGMSILGATQDPADMPSGAPKAQFQKQDVRIVTGIPFSGFSYQLTVAGQYTDSPLYSSEQIHLGDASSVRGSETTFATGDRGFYGQNTLVLPVRSVFRSLVVAQPWLQGVNFRVFSDYGRVWRVAEQSSEEGIGAGIGMTIRHGRFNADTSWGKLISAGREYKGQENFSFSVGIKAF